MPENYATPFDWYIRWTDSVCHMSPGVLGDIHEHNLGIMSSFHYSVNIKPNIYGIAKYTPSGIHPAFCCIYLIVSDGITVHKTDTDVS